jgi:hypothetical protein
MQLSPPILSPAGRPGYALAAAITLVVLLTVSGLAAENSAPQFVVEIASGPPVTGRLLRLDEGWRVQLGGQQEIRTEAGALLTLRRADRPLPPYPARNVVLFANGDQVPASRIRLVEERFRIAPQIGAGQEFRVSQSMVSVIWFTVPDGARHPDQLRRALAVGQRERDQVLLRNGDLLEGTLTSMDEKAVRLEAEKREVEVKPDKIAAVALNTELVSRRRPKAPYARLVLANGCRLTLVSATSDGKFLSGKTVFGAEVQIPIEEVSALTILQARADYLSDLKPSKVELTPYLDVTMPPASDASVRGRSLRLAGSTYDKGLGVHSSCRLTYDLAGRYQRFEALVGLDEETGRGGSVRIQVLVDGKPQNVAPDRDWTARDGALTVRVDVKGAKQLTLAVEFGEQGDVQDDVDWVNARLVK